MTLASPVRPPGRARSMMTAQVMKGSVLLGTDHHKPASIGAVLVLDKIERPFYSEAPLPFAES